MRYTLIISSEKIVVTDNRRKIHCLLKRAILASNSAVDAIIERAEECGKVVIMSEEEGEFSTSESTICFFAYEM